MTRTEFIEQSKALFGDRFGYIRISVNMKLMPGSKITLCCPDHGDFKTTVHKHLTSPKWGGCIKCQQKFGQKKSRLKHKNANAFQNNALDTLAAEGTDCAISKTKVFEYEP